MIQLKINKATGQVTGYAHVDHAVPRSMDIAMEDGEFALLDYSKLVTGFYYIEDGKIVKKDEKDSFTLEYEAALEELDRARDAVENEQHVFMDAVIGGMSVKAASALAKENREKLEAAENTLMELQHREYGMARERLSQDMADDGTDYAHTLSIVTVVRDENRYLPEWIRYYVEDVGVDHFYIYDNGSEVPVSEALEGMPYYDKCTVIPWATTVFTQKDTHDDFLHNYGDETKWVLMCDPDEYLVLEESGGYSSIKDLLDQNNDAMLIWCSWVYYNANGQEKRTDGTDMERFTKAVEWDGHQSGKYIARTRAVSEYKSHVPYLKYLSDYPVGTQYDEARRFDGLKLNHYYTRSFEEWCEKMKRGSCHPYALRRFSDFFELNPDMAYLDTGEDWAMAYGPAASENAAENDAELEDAVEADESGDMGNAEPDEKTSG